MKTLFFFLIIGALAAAVATTTDYRRGRVQQECGQENFTTTTRTSSPFYSTIDPSVLLQKKRIHATTRFLFLAGTQGSGHSQWQQALNNTICQPVSQRIHNSLFRLWYHKKLERQEQHAQALKKALQEQAAQNSGGGLYCLNLNQDGDFMRSMEMQSKGLMYPSLYSLAQVTEAAHVDLRIIVLHRHPLGQVASSQAQELSKKQDDGLDEQVHLFTNAAAMLNSQLATLSPDFFECSGYSTAFEKADQLEEFVAQGMMSDGSSLGLADALKENYQPRKPEDLRAIAKKLEQMTTTGTKIDMKIKIRELQYYNNFLVQVLCPRMRAAAPDS